VRVVLEREKSVAPISITFVGPHRIRQLNAAWRGEDRVTDVLAFTLPLPSGVRHGDVYICRAVALREARRRGIPVAQELARLVIHGTLHVLGWDHPEGVERIRSPMWRRQERYLACLG
jgi:probable rRNA maturation factor